MIDSTGKLSLYDILGVSPNSSREEIEQACWRLWQQYQSRSTTPLWKEIKGQIEHIHDTLLDPRRRASYDAKLGRLPRIAPSAAAPAEAWWVRKGFHLAGLASALLFRWMIEATTPQSWADMQTIGVLSLVFAGAVTCLLRALKGFYGREDAGAGAG